MQRRDFVKFVGLGSLALGLPGGNRLWAKPFKKRGKKVAILGGGVGGLTAAHELLERGFDVSVYEYRAEPGGKARSIPVPNTGTEGREDLPGEHGFRFFPAFYFHLRNTMSRIPFKNNIRGVLDNLVPIEQGTFAVGGQRDVIFQGRTPRTHKDFRLLFEEMFTPKFGIPREELKFFADRLHTFLTSCEERRLAEYEKMPWMDFVDGHNKSENYRRFLALGLTRNLVAAKGDKVSARTVGQIAFQLIQGTWSPQGSFGFFLNGPTTETWIAPWMKLLHRLGLDYHGDSRCVGLNVENGEMTGARVVENGIEKTIDADWYIAALPAEVMARLVNDDLVQSDIQFERIPNIVVDWMTGAQYYFDRPLNLGKQGAVSYVDSPWALTSVTQSYYWKRPITSYGNGEVKGLVSVDISNWHTPGILYGKQAKHCSKEEIKHEVLAQILALIDGKNKEELMSAKLLEFHLDPGIRFEREGLINEDPLLINTPDSWKDRPEATTGVENLFLASDYVRSYSDLACMEAANEAARRAVNGLLYAGNFGAPYCAIQRLQEPAIFATAKHLDKARFAMGKPHPGMKS